MNPNILSQLTVVLCFLPSSHCLEGQLLGPPLLALHLQHLHPAEVSPHVQAAGLVSPEVVTGSDLAQSQDRSWCS